MKKRVILIMGVILLFTSCYKTEVKDEKITAKEGQLVGAPYELELDQRGEDALVFIRSTEKDLGKVSRYRRQIVAGVNHYFEFTKMGRPPMEVIVYENLDGEYKVMSKGVLE
ncbi:hypothetical protein NRK67_14660 [Fusobacteria bacterium ZRK30]|nr:hypothetical protein NRK67_14660 [Fusobacteria bacterium ZRK30]